jgi:hypothetical protein
MNLLVLEVELSNDPRTKLQARRLDPIGTTRDETPTGLLPPTLPPPYTLSIYLEC